MLWIIISLYILCWIYSVRRFTAYFIVEYTNPKTSDWTLNVIVAAVVSILTAPFIPLYWLYFLAIKPLALIVTRGNPGMAARRFLTTPSPEVKIAQFKAKRESKRSHEVWKELDNDSGF